MRLATGSENTVSRRENSRLTQKNFRIPTKISFFNLCRSFKIPSFTDPHKRPFVAGTLIDSTCQFWKVDHCTGDRMNCQLFEPISYRQGFGLVMLVPGLLACAGFMWISNILTKNSFREQNHDKLLS